MLLELLVDSGARKLFMCKLKTMLNMFSSFRFLSCRVDVSVRSISHSGLDFYVA